MESLISIIIPTYNRAHLIGETVESIQNQTYEQWECIIVDDGSTDDTEEVVLKYIEKDMRITYYKKPSNLPKGPSAARNYGFTKSKGMYINWFDSDDLMHPEKLETDLKHLASGDFDFTISQSSFFRKNGTPKKMYWNTSLWSEDPINDFITKKIGWSINVPLWKKISLERCQLKFDEKLMTGDDFKYHIQAMQFGLKPIVTNQVAVRQREHDSRLNNYPLKAPYKLKVNEYLIINKNDLKLTTETVFSLKVQFHKQFTSLLKHKELCKAYTCIKKRSLYDLSFSQKKRLYVGVLMGGVYKVFGIGYSFLK
ncbi:glycosyltransferase family 2 protein [Mangrovimonas yunxiaonensis]|uniref:glycosyltransferase family 2 protein n=1 Tax=Mangrovimonas yunxiaonensis TaxID=1197477 RepID=UPI000AFB1E31|nr:glycosyltransferase family 2 protein [Mangrovimonas yunxiaonensis]GGH46001.1 glycosyl transferase [Mangrovimonas yunxiaonensis]